MNDAKALADQPGPSAFHLGAWGMSDFYDYIAVWLPIIAVALGFLCVAVVFSRGLEGIGRFEKFTRIFLSEGATLKTWGLFISCFTVSLLLSGIIAKLAADQSWPHDHFTAVARIGFFREVALGLLLLLAIILGAFGAVAFKGQLGAANFQLNQDGGGQGGGNLKITATAGVDLHPAPPAGPGGDHQAAPGDRAAAAPGDHVAAPADHQAAPGAAQVPARPSSECGEGRKPC